MYRNVFFEANILFIDNSLWGSGNGRVTFCGKSQEQLLDTLSYFVLSAVRKFKTASMQSLILVKLK